MKRKSIQQKYNDLVNDYNLLLDELSREDGLIRSFRTGHKRRFINTPEYARWKELEELK